MQPWNEIATASPIDEAVSKLVAALKAYHGVGVGSNLFHQALFPDGFIALLSRISGEHSEFGRGCVCWLDSIDHIDLLRWRSLSDEIAGAGADKPKVVALDATRTAQYPGYESKRAEAASSLIALLRILSTSTECAATTTLASLGSDVLHGPSFGAPNANPLPVRSLLLPASTRRLLAAAEWTDPSVLNFDGGLPADALLPVLRARHREAYREPLCLPHGSSQAAVAAATAEHTALRIAPRDAIICYLMNWLTSKTRRRDVQRHAPGHYAALPFRPLAYTTASPNGSLVADRPFLVWLWETIDACTLPVKGVVGSDAGGSSASGSMAPASELAALVFPPPGVPDAELFLAAACAYWLGENHPYAVVPLPGQTSVPAAPAQQAALGREWVRAAPASTASAAEVRTTFGPKSEKKAPLQWRTQNGGEAGGASSSGSAWAASLASAFATPTPASGGVSSPLTDPLAAAGTYNATSVDVAEAVMLLWTLQLTDVSVAGVMGGRESSSAVIGREQPASGGPSLLRLAGDAAARAQGVSLEGGAGDVSNLVRQLSASEAGRKLLVDTGGRGGAGVVPIPAGLRDILTGPTRMPEVLSRLHAPMFHWLRVHMARAEVKGDALEFAAVVDVWLAVLTPWRARPRYKAAKADLRGLRGARFFDYSAAAERALRGRVEATRRAGRPARGELDVVDVPMAELAQEARSTAAYAAVLAATGDFSGGRLAATAPTASLPADHLSLETWAPWVRLFAPFYTHLLAVFLRRMRTADFTQDAWLRTAPTPAIAAEIAGGPGIGPTPPRGPLLLELLERVLDVFEPGVIAILRDAEAEAEGLFPRAAAHGRGVSDGLSLAGSGSGKAHPPARMAARVQLLAGVQLLCLPPDVLPSAVLPSLSSLTEKADLVARRLQAALDGPSLGPAPMASGAGGDGAGSSSLLFVRMPEVAVPEGACVNGVRNLAHWDGMVAGVCETSAFLVSPLTAVLGILLHLAGRPDLLDALFAGSRAGVVAVFGVIEAVAAALGLSGGSPSGTGAGAPLAATFRMGDRLQLSQDRLRLAFGRDATPSTLPPPTSLRLRARAPTIADRARGTLRSAVAWCLLRPVSQTAPNRGERPYGAWESGPLITATDAISTAAREAVLFLAALVLAGIARANPDRPAPVLSVFSLPSALQGNVLRSLGMADVRVLPLWLVWMLLARAIGLWYASVAAVVAFGALRVAV